MTVRRPPHEKAKVAVAGSLSVFALRDDKCGRNDGTATAHRKRATFPTQALGLPRGNRFRILCTPMTFSRLADSARPRRMLIAFAGLIIACGTAEIAGDDSPPRAEGARVEINGGGHKGARVEVTIDRSKAKRTEILSD